ncbi:N-acetylmuramoyl-L-alanine amidase [Amaricoccus tamworthensis]|uniref:N-acetylmuramoyl-L-alanine amidase n=1 Tax=Amaricoccus tamworthensis TaxID=57002 RepID=UPI003C7A3E88
MRILEHPSPNFGPRRDGLRPSLVLLHHTAMETAEAALDRLCDPEAEVSSHYLIARDGRVWRLVDEAERAWHAGLGRWKGLDDINSRSIGIELANPASLKGFPPFPEVQMAALEALLWEILSRWGIPAEGVIGHSDIAPERKADPGPKFDWGRLALQGLAAPSVVSEAGTGGWNAFETRAAAAGYDVADNSAEAVLRAVRLRHRPWAEGKAPDAWDVGCLTQPGKGQD